MTLLSPPQLSGTGWLGRATWTITILGFAASAAIVLLFSVLEIIRHGGNAYKHGDWLVNALEEPVRRGAFGSALLHLSDALQVSPLLVVGMLQVVLVAALYLLTLAVLRNLPWQPALLLLVITPAFFVIFWLADTQGSLRKELITYTAVILMITSIRTGSQVQVVAACALYAVACLAHEVDVLFLPLFLLVTWLAATNSPHRTFCLAAGGVTAAVALACLAYALNHVAVEDYRSVCDPLVARGLPESICSGAVEWMEEDVAYSRRQLVGELAAKPNYPLLFSLAYVLALAPILFFVSRLSRPWVVAAVVLLLGLPFLPLYPTVIDWGRWMNFHVTSGVFAILALLQSGRVRIVRETPPSAIFGFLLFGLLWSPGHEIARGILVGGPTVGVVGELLRIVEAARGELLP